MCIAQSVGRHGVNNRYDTLTIQILLNLNMSKLTPLGLLTADGIVGNRTIAVIEEFERRILCVNTPIGRIDPNAKALSKLREGIPDDFLLEPAPGDYDPRPFNEGPNVL
jgi:hypothetical protein